MIRFTRVLLFSLVVVCLAPISAFSQGVGTVVINEIMYHPSSENTLEEYIELFNSGSTAINLADWKFTAGVKFTFPAVTIQSGAYLVVSANTNVFIAKYPGVENVI